MRGVQTLWNRRLNNYAARYKPKRRRSPSTKKKPNSSNSKLRRPDRPKTPMKVVLHVTKRSMINRSLSAIKS